MRGRRGKEPSLNFAFERVFYLSLSVYNVITSHLCCLEQRVFVHYNATLMRIRFYWQYILKRITHV